MPDKLGGCLEWREGGEEERLLQLKNRGNYPQPPPLDQIYSETNLCLDKFLKDIDWNKLKKFKDQQWQIHCQLKKLLTC